MPRQVCIEGRRHVARGGVGKRFEGAGVRHRLVFIDRLVATSVHLQHDLPHSVLGLGFGVDRSNVTRPVGEVRALPAAPGGVPECSDPRLRALTDVFA